MEKITMTIDTKQANFPHEERTYGIGAKAGYFTRHMLEMCIAMCIGWAVLGVLFGRAVGLIGISNPNIDSTSTQHTTEAINIKPTTD